MFDQVVLTKNDINFIKLSNIEIWAVRLTDCLFADYYIFSVTNSRIPQGSVNLNHHLKESDKRTSAVATGVVAILMLSVLFVVLVITDGISFYQAISKGNSNCSNLLWLSVCSCQIIAQYNVCSYFLM